MFLINPSIEYLFASTSTASVSCGTIGYKAGRQSCPGINCLWGYWRSIFPHDMSMRISLPRSISALLMVVYYDGSGIVPKVKKGIERILSPQMRCMFMQSARLHGWIGVRNQDMFSQSGWFLKAIWDVCMRSCRVSLEERIRKKQGRRVSLSTQLSTERTYGPLKEHSWVTCLLV